MSLFTAYSVRPLLLLALTLILVGHANADDPRSSDEDVFVTYKPSYRQDQQGIHYLCLGDFFINKKILATNTPWLPGQGQIPTQLGRQVQCVNAHLQRRYTNAVQISLETIDICPALNPTNQSILFFSFLVRQQSELTSKFVSIVTLLDGTIATERAHSDSAHTESKPGLKSAELLDERMAARQRPIEATTHGDPRAQHKSEFQIPGIQWGATVGDDYPADLCAQEALAASYLKTKLSDVQTLKLERIVLDHYIPMQAIIANSLEVPPHLNHWSATFYFRDGATDSSYLIPVLLDNRILGFEELIRK